MSKSIIKILGLAAMVIGFGADALGEWTKEKKLDETVERKVNEALAAKANEEESETEEES